MPSLTEVEVVGWAPRLLGIVVRLFLILNIIRGSLTHRRRHSTFRAKYYLFRLSVPLFEATY
eukprot:scaffold2845_cov405-Pavlova_lutheri.AAC.3